MTPEELFRAVGMDRKGRKDRMQRMGDAIVGEWSSQARRHGDMDNVIDRYTKHLAIRDLTATSVTVELPSRRMKGQAAMVVRMFEFGMGPGGIGSSGPYDVRRFLLTRQNEGSQPIKKGKSGPYRDVSFGYSQKRVKAMAGSGYGQAMRDLKKRATQVKDNSWNGKALRPGYTAIVNNPNTNIPHRTDRMHGLRLMAKRKGKGSYVAVRRASWNGNPWMSKGIKARRIGDRVRREIPRLWRTIS